MEKYPRGRRGGFAKALGRATGAGVRIPPSPPKRPESNPAAFCLVFRQFQDTCYLMIRFLYSDILIVLGDLFACLKEINVELS